MKSCLSDRLEEDFDLADSSSVTDSPLDDAPPDDLARAFELPAWLNEENAQGLRELHSAIVSRLRSEARGMPMNTVQQLLLERIAYNYVVLKFKEETNGFTTATQQKDFNTWWLSMTQEFNKLLMANQDKMREALLLEVQRVTTEALSLVKDPDDRRNVRLALSEGFAAIDL